MIRYTRTNVHIRYTRTHTIDKYNLCYNSIMYSISIQNIRSFFVDLTSSIPPTPPPLMYPMYHNNTEFFPRFKLFPFPNSRKCWLCRWSILYRSCILKYLRSNPRPPYNKSDSCVNRNGV